MDKYELIDSIVVALNNLTVQGVANMRIVMESIQKLAGLRDGLKAEEEAAAKAAKVAKEETEDGKTDQTE